MMACRSWKRFEKGQSGKEERSSNTRPDLMFDIEAIITKNEEQVQEALAQSTNAFQRIKDEFGTKQDWWRNGGGLHTTKHRFRLFYSHVEEKMPKNHQEKPFFYSF